MSVGRPIDAQLIGGVVNDEQYRHNLAYIAHIRAAADRYEAMNEAAKKAYDKQRELLTKIEEGKRAVEELSTLTNAPSSRSLLLEPGPSNQASTNYNSAWSPADYQSSGTTKMKDVQPGPQLQPYGATSSTASYTTHYHANSLPQQYTQQPQQQSTAQSAPAMQYMPSFVQERGQPHQQPVSRAQQMDGRGRGGFSRQGPPVTDQRRALAMQPVAQRSQYQNQSLPPITNTTVAREPTPGSTTQNSYTYPPAPNGVFPNFVNQAPLSSTRPNAASSTFESSLSGALDVTNVRQVSKAAPPSSSTTQTEVNLDAVAARLQEQIASARSSWSSPQSMGAPSTATAERGGNDSSHPNLSSSRATPPNQLSPEFLKQLRDLVTEWSPAAALNSSVYVQGTHLRLHKDNFSRIHVVYPMSVPGTTGSIPIEKILGAQTFERATHNTSMSEQSQKYRPYSIPQHPTISQPTQPTESAIPGLANFRLSPTPALATSSSTAGTSALSSTLTARSLERVAAQADKKRLAKDILRALSGPLGSLKRPQPSDIPAAHSLQPPAKRHASGQGVLASGSSEISNGTAPLPLPKSPPLQLQPGSSIESHVDVLSHAAALPHSPARDYSVPNADENTPPPLSRSTPPQIKSDSPPEISADVILQATTPLLPPISIEVQPTEPVDVNAPRVAPNPTLLQPNLPSPIRGTVTPPEVPAGNFLPGVYYRKGVEVPLPHSQDEISKPIPAQTGVSAMSQSVSTSQYQITSIPMKSPLKTSQADNIFPVHPRQKTPLFLPSPISSPVTKPTSGIYNDIPNQFNLDNTGKSQPFYILVPPLPKGYALRRKGQLGREQLFTSLSEWDEPGVEAGPSVRSGQMAEIEIIEVEDEDIEKIDLNPASDGFANGEAERVAVSLSCSRIAERICKWKRCDVVLSSTEKLIQHLAMQHFEEEWTYEGLSICMWQQCGRHEEKPRKLFSHIKTHALIPLQCAYRDCQETFRTPRQLLRHHQKEHGNDILKPLARPFASAQDPLPDIPAPEFPSYLLESVRQPHMSQERHATLGPWVLRQIAGPVSLEVKRYNLTSKLLRSSSNGEKQTGNQPYDFLNFPSTNYSTTTSQPSRIRGLEDLDSGEVSDMVSDGLVLFGVLDEVKEETEGVDELLLTSEPAAEATDKLVEEITLERSDEQDVEVMLAQIDISLE